jgi:hypothetical protein
MSASDRQGTLPAPPEVPKPKPAPPQGVIGYEDRR